MDLITRLKIKLGKLNADAAEDLLMLDTLESAKSLFLSLRYPFMVYPADSDGEPIIEKRWHDWILRAAIEIYSKIGAEGQTSHSENSISRTYDSGTVSKSLLAEITPLVGVAK